MNIQAPFCFRLSNISANSVQICIILILFALLKKPVFRQKFVPAVFQIKFEFQTLLFK